MIIPPIDTSPENLAYISNLKVGEEVVEMGQSCMYGKRGVVYLSKDRGDTCVKWFITQNGKETWMGTSVTWGTRRISDVDILPK